MRRPLRSSLLLTLALVLGQWLVLAHAFEHPALAKDAACQICIHAQGLDGAALSVAPAAATLTATVEVPAAPPYRAPSYAALSSYDIRGPPAAA